jgi:Cu/Ag efflux protein CusF
MGGSTAGGTAAGSAAQSQVTGKVEKVDQSKKELSLRLKVSDTTQVMKDGKTASLSDIKEGDQVRASFDSSGEPVRIDVTSSSGSGSKSSPSGSPGSSGSSGSSGGSSTGGSSSGGSSGRGY